MLNFVDEVGITSKADLEKGLDEDFKIFSTSSGEWKALSYYYDIYEECYVLDIAPKVK